MMLIWIIAHAAFAGPVVLHRDADADAVRGAVIANAGMPVSDLTVTHFDAFRASLVPTWSGLGALEQCTGAPVSGQDLSQKVKKAEGSILYMEMDKAFSLLAEADKSLPCLSSPVDPVLAARIGFLSGVVSVELGDKSGAWAHFANAARFAPQIEWDAQFSKDGLALLNAAKSERNAAHTVSLALIPRISLAHTLYVNGVSVDLPVDSLALKPGDNLIQLRTPAGFSGYTATLEPDSSPSVLMPAGLRPDALADVATDAGRSGLSRVIAGAFEAGTPNYVSHSDQLWRTASGIGAWEDLRAEKLAVGSGSSVATGAVKPLRWLAASLTAAAALGTVSALVVGVNGGQSGSKAQDQFDSAAARGDFDGASAAYTAAVHGSNRSTSGYIVAGFGAAMTVAGVVITIPMFRGDR